MQKIHNRHIRGVCLLSAVLVMAAGCMPTKQGATRLAEPSMSTGSAGLRVKTKAAFSGHKEIAIGGFKVAFLTKLKGSHRPRGGLLDGPSVARATATSVLTDVPEETMQQIVDKAYQDFTAKLREQGYTVRRFSDLSREYPALAELESDPSPYKTDDAIPGIKTKALIFSPKAMNMRLMHGQAGVSKIFKSPGAAYSEVAAKSGVPIIDVYYAVDFASFGGHVSRDTASVSVGQQISVRDGSGLDFIGGHAGTFSKAIGGIWFKEPIGTNIEFASISTKEKSTSEKVGNALATAAALLLGGGTRVSDTYFYHADPAQYEIGVLDVLSKSNKALVNRMAVLREQ